MGLFFSPPFSASSAILSERATDQEPYDFGAYLCHQGRMGRERIPRVPDLFLQRRGWGRTCLDLAVPVSDEDSPELRCSAAVEQQSPMLSALSTRVAPAQTCNLRVRATPMVLKSLATGNEDPPRQLLLKSPLCQLSQMTLFCCVVNAFLLSTLLQGVAAWNGLQSRYMRLLGMDAVGL